MEANQDVPKSQLSRIFQMMALNGFGLGFISIFIPVYLLKLGYSFSMVVAWILIQQTVLLFSCFASVFISNKIGLVRCLHIRFAFLATYLLLMFALPSHPFLFCVIPVLMGIEAAFYWMPLNILFLRNTEKETMGGSLSKFFTYPKIASLLCPLIGAFIITKFNFPVLFSIALFFVFIAFIPLLPLSSHKTHFTFSKKTIFEIWQKNRKFFIPEMIDNFMEDAAAIVGIFVYLKLLSVTQVGLIGTIASVSSILFTLTLGKLTDRWDKHKLLKIGAFFVIAVWVYVAVIGQFFPHAMQFYIAAILLTLSTKTFLVPYQSMLFNAAREHDAQFLILREVPNILGRLILYSLAIILYDKLPVLFLIVGILFIYFLCIDSRKFTHSAP